MIASSIVLTNLLCALVGIWAGMYVNAKFIRPASLNRMRFRLYELRDSLAILAMRGQLEEGSEEYTTLRGLINGSISSTKEFRITTFLRMHFEMAVNEDLQKHVSHILAKVENKEMSEEYRNIVQEYFKVNRALYMRKMRLLRFGLTPLIVGIRSVVSVLKLGRTFMEYLDRQQDKVLKIDDVFNKNSQHLHRA